MAHLRPRYRKKDGKKALSGYAAEFYDPDRHPQRKYVTLRTKDKRVARTKLVALEGKFSRGEWDPWQNAAPEAGVFFAEAVARYLKGRGDRRPKTQRADASTLGLFGKDLPPGALLQHVEARHIEAFLGRDLSAATLSTYHTRIKTFFSWCVDQGLCRESPMAKTPKPKLKRKEKQFLTRAQYERLQRCIEAEATMHAGILKAGEVIWLLDVVKFAVGSGLRLGELTALRWSAVDLENCFITVRNANGFTTKSGHERSIPVRGEALDVLLRLSEERTSEEDSYVFRSRRGRVGDAENLNGEYVSKRFLHFVRLAKLPEGMTFHSLRHTYISWLIMDGVPVPVVQKLAGHADISTTMGYAHLSPDSLQNAVEQVFGI